VADGPRRGIDKSFVATPAKKSNNFLAVWVSEFLESGSRPSVFTKIEIVTVENFQIISKKAIYCIFFVRLRKTFSFQKKPQALFNKKKLDFLSGFSFRPF
jgi:hypothetical protein